MENIRYKITFYSYWHVGGKEGANMEVDTTPLKDKNGFPYIGGKTLKGLIKRGASYVTNYQKELVSQKFIRTVFGEQDQSYDNGSNNVIYNKFSSARLSPKIEKKYTGLLYHKKQYTALDHNKQAIAHSLRVIEATIPLELEASIENFTGNKEMLKISLKAVKKLGVKRFRGFGRCVFEIIENT